ncbi:MAG: tRNA pseudouridine(38-40) synthase TruA [Balneolaceae bacterium]
MPRYKLTIEYDGTNFSGWQIQPDAVTVEQTLEDAFQQILQQKVDLIGQGRTDAGVHARGQTAHVDFSDEVDVQKLVYGVNGIVGEEIQITEIEKVSSEFHSRFDALSREYEYTITTRCIPLMHHCSWQLKKAIDMQKLEKCATMLNGEFDFAGFSKFNEDNFTTLCEIQRSEFEVEGEVIKYHIRSNRFLRNMVRRLLGTMVRVAEGKITIKNFQRILENTETQIPSYTAPAKGLILEKVYYNS